ncbi:hypothetical protein AO741_20785 [Pseudomonas sp. TTU2014-105ASC]|nr:hypothetical protein AO741_20785 [Pseudomonas sp. TTU2014-105ASC]
MNQDIHDAIHEIVLEIVNASELEDKQSQWAAYQRLAAICESTEKAGNNHPFQWETLGDFTNDKTLALGFYEKALGYAVAAELNEYVASICLAIAETLVTIGKPTKAKYFAAQANEAAASTDDLELRRSISELELQLSNGT